MGAGHGLECLKPSCKKVISHYERSTRLHCGHGLHFQCKDAVWYSKYCNTHRRALFLEDDTTPFAWVKPQGTEILEGEEDPSLPPADGSRHFNTQLIGMDILRYIAQLAFGRTDPTVVERYSNRPQYKISLKGWWAVRSVSREWRAVWDRVFQLDDAIFSANGLQFLRLYEDRFGRVRALKWLRHSLFGNIHHGYAPIHIACGDNNTNDLALYLSDRTVPIEVVSASINNVIHYGFREQVAVVLAQDARVSTLDLEMLYSYAKEKRMYSLQKVIVDRIGDDIATVRLANKKRKTYLPGSSDKDYA